jgi:hypothetical protein
MSWIDDIGLSDALSTAKSAATDVMGLYKDYNASTFDMKNQQLQTDIQLANLNNAKIQLNTQSQLQQMQSQYQLKMAQGQLNNASFYAGSGLDMTPGNMNTILGRSTGSNSLMMWLTVAGIGIAVLQYLKK